MKNSIASAAIAASLFLSTLPLAIASPAAPATLQTPEVKPAEKPAEKPADKTGDYNVNKEGLALGGYDPVAYFPEHGGKAKKGDKKITAKHEGITYRFSSEKNKKAFTADPAKFTPMYGGWCAWAMAEAEGKKVDASPKSFTVEDGNLYLFYDSLFADTRKSWKKKGGAPKLKAEADKFWTKDSGEPARGDKKPKDMPKDKEMKKGEKDKDKDKDKK